MFFALFTPFFLWLGLEAEFLTADGRLVHQAAYGMHKHSHAFICFVLLS
jgi:hypothetical protein